MMSFFSTFVSNEVGSIFFLSLAIILSAFLLEDLTTIIVGILAAEGYISIPLALLSLYTGIVLGDATLYLIGRVARTHPRLAHYLDHDYTTSFRTWLENRYTMIIFSGHFVPGLRFTTYVASGFFRRPLSLFIPTAIAGGLVLGTALFSLSYWFGSVTSEWMRSARWLIALVFILILISVSRRNFLSYRAKYDAPDSGADMHAP